MIYYPLTTVMLAGIRDILLISTPRDIPILQNLLGTGNKWGLSFSYAVQNEPRGIADALIIGEEFVGEAPTTLILGDNIFYGHGLTTVLESAAQDTENATIFAYRVRDPLNYGVVELDSLGSPIAIIEKPKSVRSHLAVTGLYFYPPGVAGRARDLTPSARGELEITDVNATYMKTGNLKVKVLHRGFAWLDTGTHESLHQAASFVQTVQERQGQLIASPDEIAWRLGYIDTDELMQIAHDLSGSAYGEFLAMLGNGDSESARSSTP
jgi:glucose-1-phosphate thymidylyltransferase